VPLLPACLIEPLWVEFATLIRADDRREFAPNHPWGCHRRRSPDRVVFDHIIAALVHGSGYERIASPDCSDRTIRRRQWVRRGRSGRLGSGSGRRVSTPADRACCSSTVRWCARRSSGGATADGMTCPLRQPGPGQPRGSADCMRSSWCPCAARRQPGDAVGALISGPAPAGTAPGVRRLPSSSTAGCSRRGRGATG
jgi:hypothetical protein